jgi:hypothetical protein
MADARALPDDFLSGDTGFEFHLELRALAKRYGASLLSDPAALRQQLGYRAPDGLEAASGLLVDACTADVVQRLATHADEGMPADLALASVAVALAQRTSHSLDEALWATSALGFAARQLPENLVPVAVPTSLVASNGSRVPPADPDGEERPVDAEPADRGGAGSDGRAPGRASSASWPLAAGALALVGVLGAGIFLRSEETITLDLHAASGGDLAQFSHLGEEFLASLDCSHGQPLEQQSERFNCHAREGDWSVELISWQPGEMVDDSLFLKAEEGRHRTAVANGMHIVSVVRNVEGEVRRIYVFDDEVDLAAVVRPPPRAGASIPQEAVDRIDASLGDNFWFPAAE